MVSRKIREAVPASTYFPLPYSIGQEVKKIAPIRVSKSRKDLSALHSEIAAPTNKKNNALIYINDYHDLFMSYDFPKFLKHPIYRADDEIHRLRLTKQFLSSAKELFHTITEIEPDIFEYSSRLNFHRKQILNLVEGSKIFNEINLLSKAITKHGLEGVRPALNELYTQVLELQYTIPSEIQQVNKVTGTNAKSPDIPDGTNNVIYASERLKRNFEKWLKSLASDQHYETLLKKLSLLDNLQAPEERHGIERYSAIGIGKGSKLVGQRYHGVVIEIKIEGSKARIYGIEHPHTHKFVIVGWSRGEKEQEHEIIKSLNTANIFKNELR